MNSIISANSDQGRPIYTQGNPPSFFGLPAGMTGSQLSFLGSFDGNFFFPILDYNRQPLSFPTRILQPAKNPILTGPAAIIPFEQTELLEGIQFIQPVSNAKEAANRTIELYFVDDND
jgi:hypothetical protein